MSNKKLKRVSLFNLMAGYLLTMVFVLLMLFNHKTDTQITTADHNTTNNNKTIVVHEQNTTFTSSQIHTAVRHVPVHGAMYVDKLTMSGQVVNDQVVFDHDYNRGFTRDRIVPHDDRVLYDLHDEVDHHSGDYRYRHNKRKSSSVTHDTNHRMVDHDDVDYGLLDRRLDEKKLTTRDHVKDKRGHDFDVGNLVVDDQDDDDLLIDDELSFNKPSQGAGSGEGLYAYNYPSMGVGAGVGSPGVGAVGGYAGVGAGMGQAVAQGVAVAALGGVGTPSAGAPASELTVSGVGGLVSGGGSGAAAGLLTGQVMTKLGVGPGTGVGMGGAGYNYDHLPKDGALHIMLHVDGSGSILNTRKQLEVMKDTLLKDRLLPYYNNDESLYNRRVTIVDSSGERSLKFFAEAAAKDNVLAVAFQDEAQPVYHLPNFNKNPEKLYLDDLHELKQSLNHHDGVYRGVIIQVDRGKTFAKSFKEFVENSLQGKGYLVDDNLKRYHRDDNSDNIRNGTGVVFSDEYHASDAGDPDYYMNLLLNVSSRVGLDLQKHGGGLTDGTHTSN